MIRTPQGWEWAYLIVSLFFLVAGSVVFMRAWVKNRMIGAAILIAILVGCGFLGYLSLRLVPCCP